MAAFAVPLITAGLSGLAGLFGGRPKTTTTTTDQTQKNEFDQSASTNPNFSPLQQKLMEMFGQQARQFATPNLGQYAQQQLQQIGQQGNLNRQIIANSLASRGLSYSPAAQSPFTQNLMNVGAQQNQFLAQMPLLARQYQQQAFQNLLGAFGAIPTGQTSTSSGTSTGTSHGTQVGQQSGNMLGGLASGLGVGIPLAFPQLFGGGQNQVGAAIPQSSPYNIPMPNYGPPQSYLPPVNTPPTSPYPSQPGPLPGGFY